MSLWTSITSAVKKVAAPILTKAIPGLGTASIAYDVASALGSAGKATVKTVRAVPGKGIIAGGAVGAGLAGMGGGERRKYRRMNYANGKAAMRAVRRIKGTRKLLQKIEKQLPHRTVHRRS